MRPQHSTNLLQRLYCCLGSFFNCNYFSLVLTLIMSYTDQSPNIYIKKSQCEVLIFSKILGISFLWSSEVWILLNKGFPIKVLNHKSFKRSSVSLQVHLEYVSCLSSPSPYGCRLVVLVKYIMWNHLNNI